MDTMKIQRIKAETEKVLERYRNSIPRKAFIQFASNVLVILNDEDPHNNK